MDDREGDALVHRETSIYKVVGMKKQDRQLFGNMVTATLRDASTKEMITSNWTWILNLQHRITK